MSMEQEHSLLDQISRKEGELKEEYYNFCRQAEGKIHEARERARIITQEAEREGSLEEAASLEKGLKELADEIDHIHQAGMAEGAKILQKGEKNMKLAADWIVETIMKG